MPSDDVQQALDAAIIHAATKVTTAMTGESAGGWAAAASSLAEAAAWLHAPDNSH